MVPHTHLLAGLAKYLGSALAFADDVSETQIRFVGSPSTRTSLNANARSFVIGELRKAPIDGYRLLERHTDLNKVEMQHVESHARYWLKSETAVNFTFERAEPLFSFPSNWHVLTFAIVETAVAFKHAPISRLKNKRYKLEAPLEFDGRFPLGGAVPPGGYPPSRATGVFDAGPEDDFGDILGDDDEQTGEESG